MYFPRLVFQFLETIKRDASGNSLLGAPVATHATIFRLILISSTARKSPAGSVQGQRVYGPDGSHSGSFAPAGNRIGHVVSVDRVGTVMLAGYEDFPGPEEF